MKRLIALCVIAMSIALAAATQYALRVGDGLALAQLVYGSSNK